MISGAKLLLVQAAMIVTLLPLSDPRVDGKRKSYTKCEPAALEAKCGEFVPPSSSDARIYDCAFNKRFCGMTCKFKCQKGPDGKRLKISNRRYAREFYKCEEDKWVRRDVALAYCEARVPVKEVRQNFYLPQGLNQLANKLMTSSFYYLAMASFYERADVALPGFSKLMTELWQADMKHARDVMTYANTRGGFINLETIERPSSHEDLIMTLGKKAGLAGMKAALTKIRDTQEWALAFQAKTMESKKAKDPHMKHFLDDGLLSYNVETIKKLADLQHQLETFPNEEDYNIGEYSMDLLLRE